MKKFITVCVTLALSTCQLPAPADTVQKIVPGTTQELIRVVLQE